MFTTQPSSPLTYPSSNISNIIINKKSVPSVYYSILLMCEII